MGRNLTHNVVLADARSRRIALRAHPSHRPVQLALDLTAAFPSLSRDWLLRVCEHIQLPAGLIAFVRATMSGTWAVACVSGDMTFAYALRSGIL